METARTLTEHAVAALAAAEVTEVDRLEREAPPSPAGPTLQQLSADGTMVPLVHGEWAELRTLAIGTVERREHDEGEVVPHRTDLSDFCRLTDAATFTRLAVLETQERGTARAERVCAATDGADWLRTFIDLHRSDAVRIPGTLWVFPHAAEHLGDAAHAVLEPKQARAWLDRWVPHLMHEGHGDRGARDAGRGDRLSREVPGADCLSRLPRAGLSHWERDRGERLGGPLGRTGHPGTAQGEWDALGPRQCDSDGGVAAGSGPGRAFGSGGGAR